MKVKWVFETKVQQRKLRATYTTPYLLHLIDVYGNLHQIDTSYVISSVAERVFSRVHHSIGHEASLKKLK